MVQTGDLAATGRELTCDVLVVGMGFAGLVTALRAIESKANVIAIDAQPRGWWTPGGNMIIAGGTIHLSMQSLTSPEAELVEAMTQATGGMVPPDLLSVTARNAKRSIKWLTEKRVEFLEPAGNEKTLKPRVAQGTGERGGDSFPVWGRVKPGGSQDAANAGPKRTALKLEASIIEQGGRILYGTKGTELLTGAKGRVVGLKAQDKDGRLDIKAKAVVLCTGGYERNKEMMLKYIGTHAGEIAIYCGPGCTGDGFKLAEPLGAQLRSMNFAAFSHFYSVDCHLKNDLLGAYLEEVAHNGIIVNRTGERFVDEGLGERFIGSQMTKSSACMDAWIIIDETVRLTAPGLQERIADVKEFGGTIHLADTIGELAKRSGIGPRLATTVSEFNRAVDEGKTAKLRMPRTKAVNKLCTPPFYAIPFVPGIVATYGGFLVSPKAEVLNSDKKPIPGLYAAGLSMEGSLSGGKENSAGSYVGCLGACLVFGVLAAENAVAG